MRARWLAQLVAAGDTHSLAVETYSGRMYSWGMGVDGKLGHGNTHAQRRPREVAAVTLSDFKGRESTERATDEWVLNTRMVVTAVACGPQHSLCLTHDGRLWEWGHLWGDSE